MRVSSFSPSAEVNRLSQTGVGLRSFLDSQAQRIESDGKAPQPSRLSQQDAASLQSRAPLPGSVGSLLSSIGATADSVGESRAALGKVRRELEKILGAAVKASQRRSAADHAQGQLVIDRAIAEINRLSGSGGNSSTVTELAPGRSAELLLRGGPSATIGEYGALEISGSAGQALISVAPGESFASVAQRINQLTGQTGVVALIKDGDLVFQSIDVGNDATISVKPIADRTTVSGVDEDRLVKFVVNQINPGSGDLITGTVTDDYAAELRYDGAAAGLIFDAAEFVVAGNLGGASITFDGDESLADLATLINQHTGATGVTANVSNGQLVFQSLETGSDSQISVALNYNKLSVSGVNASQVTNFNVHSFEPGVDYTLTGAITRLASQAEQSYAGQDGRVVASATFNLTGSLGSEAISIERGELLTDVADRVNQLTSSTGVSASVDGDSLVFRSLDYGSDETFSIEVTDLLDVAGVNESQITRVEVNSLAPNSHETISGSVTAAAEQAQLTYAGAAGSLVRENATFNVAGALGSASITVTKNESLADVANRVNQQSGATGVTATVVSNDLIFRSAEYGADAHAFLQVTSGTFAVTGGAAFNGGTIAYGADVAATINGVSYVGQGNELSFSHGFGSFTLEFAAGFAGAFDTFSAVSAKTADVINVSSINSSQLSSFQVNSIALGDYQTISGSVVAAAEQAELKYAGGSGSTIKNNATFRLTGNLGTAVISVVKNESLAAAAGRINQQTAVTGVTATVVNNDLFLRSVGYGSSAQAAVEVTSGTFNVTGGIVSILDPLLGNTIQTASGTDVQATVNGVSYVGQGNQLEYSQGSGNYTLNFAAGFEGAFNSIQIASTIAADNLTDGDHANAFFSKDQLLSFQIDAAIPDSVQTVSGSVIDAARQAQLTYSGASGSKVRENATIDVAGDLGSVSISVTKNESLANVAARINQESGVTGVTATVVNNDLFLRSVEYGADADVFVKVNSGIFAVTGGASLNGGQIAYGADIQARINGVDYVGEGNTLSFSDASGSYTLAFVAGFEGTFSPVKVGAIADAFNLSGGNGDGSATGVDAQAVINGQTITADVHRFTFSDALGSYTLDAAPGFEGALDPIHVSNLATPYAILGGNGDGTAVGGDFRVVVNGQTLIGAGTQYAYESETGSYLLEFAEGFSGSIGRIQVIATSAASFPIIGGNGDGTARGFDPQTAAVVKPSEIENGRGSAAVKFSVVNQLRHLGTLSLGLDAKSLGGAAGKLQDLLVGAKAGLRTNAADAVRITQQALAYVANLESILKRAASEDAESVSKLPTLGAGDAKRSALEMRTAANQFGLAQFNSSSFDSLAIFDLLFARSR
jgi:hypothetical protein